MISLLRVTSGRELVVVDALFLHTQRFQQRERRFHHGRRTAHIGVCAPQITGEPLNHIRDQSGLAVPAVVIARLDARRQPAVGETITLGMSPEDVHLFDAQSGEALAWSEPLASRRLAGS